MKREFDLWLFNVQRIVSISCIFKGAVVVMIVL